MHNLTVTRLLTVIAAIAALGVLADTVSAGTIPLKKTYIHEVIAGHCVAASGKFNDGTGKGGFGCKAKDGSVSCDAAGKCTGTCDKCSAAHPVSGNEVRWVLHDGKADPNAVEPHNPMETDTSSP